MARVFPEPLVGSFPPAVMRLYRALKAIPGDEFTLWVGLPLPGASAIRPDFLVVHADSTAFVVAVDASTDSDLEEAIHGGLFTGKPEDRTAGIAQDARARVKSFIASALEPELQAGPPAVYGIIAFPNAPHELLKQAWSENPHEGCYWLGEEFLSSEKLASCLRKLARGGLEERQLAQLRSHFTPEMVLPQRFAPSRTYERNVEAEFTPLLLDYDQEAWAKNRLYLPDATAAIAETAPAWGEASLVTGVAGSGKSLVLLFRACTQAKLDPKSRALVLTHNKALRRELEARFGELGRPRNVLWHTFFSWVNALLPPATRDIQVLQYQERSQCLTAAAKECGAEISPQWIEFLAEEFDWMQDRGITTAEEYLAAERTGRGVPLAAKQRRQLLGIYVCYRARLETMRAEDWSGRALRLWREVEAGRLVLPKFHYIYVDEAQFFAPIWLRILRGAIMPQVGRLLLAADPTQGFLKRRQSWVACGLDLRGRSTRLRRCYRNSRAILEFAVRFYRARLDDDESDLNLPDEVELSSAQMGEPPRILRMTSRQDEITRVLNEVRNFLKGGGNPEALLVLVAVSGRVKEVQGALCAAFGPDRVADAREEEQAGKLRVCSIDAGTGLEAPVVFLIGAAELLEKENDLQLLPDQRSEILRDTTRRLYMAFTRAALRLLITWVGPVPESLEAGVPPSAVASRSKPG